MNYLNLVEPHLIYFNRRTREQGSSVYIKTYTTAGGRGWEMILDKLEGKWKKNLKFNFFYHFWYFPLNSIISPKNYLFSPNTAKITLTNLKNLISNFWGKNNCSEKVVSDFSRRYSRMQERWFNNYFSLLIISLVWFAELLPWDDLQKLQELPPVPQVREQVLHLVQEYSEISSIFSIL